MSSIVDSLGNAAGPHSSRAPKARSTLARRRASGGLFGFVVAFACVVAPAPAAAEYTVVQRFQGPAAPRVRDTVVRRLMDKGANLLPLAKAEETAGTLGQQLDSVEGRRAVSGFLFVSRWITGSVERNKGGRWSARLVAIDGGSGMARWDKRLRADKLSGLRKRVAQATDELAQADQQFAVPTDAASMGAKNTAPAAGDPALATATPMEMPPRDSAEEPDEAPSRIATTAAPLALSLGLLMRNRDMSFGALETGSPISPHEQGFAPAARLTASWYPHHAIEGIPEALGLAGRLRVPLAPITAGDRRGRQYDVTHLGWSLGARARMVFGPHELAGVVDLGSERTTLDLAADGSPPPVPGVQYLFTRLGAEARFSIIDRVTAELDGAYLWLLDTGPISAAQWFPHTGGGGVEAGLRVGYLLLDDRLDVHAGVDVQHFFLSLNPEPGDPGVQQGLIASSVADTYVTLLAGASWRFML